MARKKKGPEAPPAGADPAVVDSAPPAASPPKRPRGKARKTAPTEAPAPERQAPPRAETPRPAAPKGQAAAPKGQAAAPKGQAAAPKGQAADPALLYAACRENLALYARTFLRGPKKAPYNGKFAIAPFHQEWAQLVNDHRRLLILASRNSGKTFFFTQAYHIWQAERQGAGHEGALFGGSDNLAQMNLGKIRQEVESNPKLQHLMPKRGYEWSAHALRFGNGYKLTARGMGAESRGIHPHVLTCDDILPSETLFSPRRRERDIEFYMSTIEPMLEPDGQLIIVGTPFVEGDLYTVLEKDPTLELRRYPAIDPDGKLLWGKRLGRDFLDEMRGRQGEIVFAREYLCRPISDAASLFPTEFFYRPGVADPTVAYGMDAEYYEERGIGVRFIGVDFAFSSEIGADFTVVFTIGLDSRDDIWVLDIQRTKGLPYSAQKQSIKDTAARLGVQQVVTESNQAQRIFGDDLRAETSLSIIQHYTGSEKHTLDQGLPSLRTLLENGKVRIPTKGGIHPNVERWIAEMSGFGVAEGRVISTSDHDDCGMAFYFAVLAARKGRGFRFAFGPTKPEEADASAAAAGAASPAVRVGRGSGAGGQDEPRVVLKTPSGRLLSAPPAPRALRILGDDSIIPSVVLPDWG